jgi:hypothetical protein
MQQSKTSVIVALATAVALAVTTLVPSSMASPISILNSQKQSPFKASVNKQTICGTVIAIGKSFLSPLLLFFFLRAVARRHINSSIDTILNGKQTLAKMSFQSGTSIQPPTPMSCSPTKKART